MRAADRMTCRPGRRAPTITEWGGLEPPGVSHLMILKVILLKALLGTGFGLLILALL